MKTYKNPFGVFVVICAAISIITVFITSQFSETKADIPWTATLVLKGESCWSKCASDDIYLINGPEGKFLYIDGFESVALVQIK